SPKAAQQIKNGLSTKKQFNLELPCARKDGNRYWLSLHLAPILDQREQIVNFLGVAVEITARKRAEEDMVRANRRNELFLNAAGEGILGLDLHGSITFINPAAAKMTGWDSEELTGKPASTILHQLKLLKQSTSRDAQFLEATC